MKVFRLLVLSALLSISSFSFASNHNFTSQALGMAVGLFNLEYSYRVSEYCTLGVTGVNGTGRLGSLEIEGSSYGIVWRRYLQPALEKSSPYLMISADNRDYEFKFREDDKDYFADVKGWVGSAGVGYHWFWQSFNISLGVLATSNQAPLELKTRSNEVYKDSLNQGIGLDFTIGGKF